MYTRYLGSCLNTLLAEVLDYEVSVVAVKLRKEQRPHQRKDGAYSEKRMKGKGEES